MPPRKGGGVSPGGVLGPPARHGPATAPLSVGHQPRVPLPELAQNCSGWVSISPEGFGGYSSEGTDRKGSPPRAHPKTLRHLAPRSHYFPPNKDNTGAEAAVEGVEGLEVLGLGAIILWQPLEDWRRRGEPGQI